jgi:hypothetical protein
MCPDRYHLVGHNYDLCQAEYEKLPEKKKALFRKIPPEAPATAPSTAPATAIAAAGAIVPLAALLRDGDARGKANAAAALGNLSRGNAANTAAIAAASTVESLAALMRDGNAKGKEAAARALGSLTASHSFGGVPAPSGLFGGGASAPSCGLLGSAPAPLGGVASSPAPFGGVAPPAASLFGGAPFGGVAPPAASLFGGGAAASSPLGGAPSLFAPKPAFGAAGTPGTAPPG